MTESQFRMSGAEAEQPPVVTAAGDIDLANVNEFQDVLNAAASRVNRRIRYGTATIVSDTSPLRVSPARRRTRRSYFAF